MNTKGRLWEQISSEENVLLALKRAAKQTNSSAIRNDIYKNWDSYFHEIHNMLKSRTYEFGPMVERIIVEKKTRKIHFPKKYYPDCILFYCLMNVIEPYLLEKFTGDTYSSIKGRGVQAALKKLENVLSHNRNYYFLYVDCKHYFDSIDHDIIKGMTRSIFRDKFVLQLLDDIIDLYNPGLPIGVFPAQYLANVFLYLFDHYVKEELRIEYYFRYMDDIVFILPDKESCHKTFEIICSHFDQLKLTIKRNTRIAPVSSGISFLGYMVFPDHTRISQIIKLRMKRKDAYLRKKNVEDYIYKQQMSAYYGWCIHADCVNLMRKVFADKFYLFENDIKQHYMKLNHIKQTHGPQFYWDMDKSKNRSITSIFNLNVVIFDFKNFIAFGKNKIALRCALYVEGKEEEEDYTDEDMFYSVTGSEVVNDRIKKNSDDLPFPGKFEQVTRNGRVYTTFTFI